MSEHTPMTSAFAAELRSRLDERLAALDRPGAVDVALSAVRDGHIRVDELHEYVLGPLLIETGAQWQRGDIQVWQEHFASAVVRTIVEALYPTVVEQAGVVTRNGKTALLATPSEEAHDLGLRMLADRLLLAGWNVAYLGADTPAFQIALAAKAVKADLVALSIATHYNRALLRDQIDEITVRLPGVRVGVGGPAFANDRRWPAEELLDESDLGLAPTEPSEA